MTNNRLQKFLTFLAFALLNLCCTFASQAQYPFEKFPAITYKKFSNWKTYDRLEKEQKIHFTLSIPDLYPNHDTLTLQLTGSQQNWGSGLIRVFRNERQIERIEEPMFFNALNMGFQPVQVADINGDSLCDIKLVVPYMGNGVAAMNERVIYFFQETDGTFQKISFSDKMGSDRPERDFDGDHNFEIITMTLDSHEGHSYWTFNVYNFEKNTLVNQNEKYEYPIMIQFLYRENFKVTNKISAQKMKSFERAFPEDFDQK